MPIVERRFVLTKGPPWGFRVYLDNTNVLTISKVRRHSPAEIAKLRSGDQVISLNGKHITDLNHSEAVTLIDCTFGTLDIQISRFESTSTKILTFDKTDTQIADDIQSKMNMNLIRSERTPDETRVPQSTPEPEGYVTVESATSENLITPSSPDVHPVSISKLIKEYDITDHSDNFTKKKQFSDSSFYNDPHNLYPTSEEKMEMARKVASSLYAPDNKRSKGASIFEKQRKRAEKYTLQNEENGNVNMFAIDEKKYDLAHWPGMPEHKEKSPSPMYRLGYSTNTVLSPPPPPAPPVLNEPKTVQEFMEKVQRFPKSKHNVVSPDVCFDIAAALHSSDSRGAQIFAKQKHRAQKWTLTAPEVVSAQPIRASAVGPTNNYNQFFVPDSQPNPKLVSINRAQSQSFRTETTTENTNFPAIARKPTTVIRRNSNQNPKDSLNVVNRLSMPASSTVVTEALPADNLLAATNTKWKPVKFNVPQRA